MVPSLNPIDDLLEAFAPTAGSRGGLMAASLVGNPLTGGPCVLTEAAAFHSAAMSGRGRQGVKAGLRLTDLHQRYTSEYHSRPIHS